MKVLILLCCFIVGSFSSCMSPEGKLRFATSLTFDTFLISRFLAKICKNFRHCKNRSFDFCHGFKTDHFALFWL